jgi:hypothetical protein
MSYPKELKLLKNPLLLTQTPEQQNNSKSQIAKSIGNLLDIPYKMLIFATP